MSKCLEQIIGGLKSLGLAAVICTSLIASGCKHSSTPKEKEGIVNKTVINKDDSYRNYQIVFVSYENGHKIYTMNSDGSNRKRLTDDFDNHDPTWSPDGKHLAFISERVSKKAVYVMDSDGSNQKKLCDVQNYVDGLSWSPDGKRIAFLSKSVLNRDYYKIYTMNSDGSDIKSLTDNKLGNSPSFSWSPDGKKIALNPTFGLYVINLDENQTKELIRNVSGCSSISWSPDGKRIGFTCSGKILSYNSENSDIYVINSDGKELKRYTDNDSDEIFLTWSPDGKRIGFLSWEPSGRFRVSVINSDGREEKRFGYAAINLSEKYPLSWSPDSKWIVTKQVYSDCVKYDGHYDDVRTYLINTDNPNDTKALTYKDSKTDSNHIFSPRNK